ncbi:MAG: hypothetical protein ACKOA9_09255 [Actinomycetota bacterium]
MARQQHRNPTRRARPWRPWLVVAVCAGLGATAAVPSVPAGAQARGPVEAPGANGRGPAEGRGPAPAPAPVDGPGATAPGTLDPPDPAVSGPDDAAGAADVAGAAAASTVSFSGRTWTVKTSRSKVGPGPNVFSAANVTVDASGYLHLRITKSGRSWTCGEVVLNESLGYGTYEWELGSDVSNLNSRVVLGLFTWNDLPDYNHREIDFEAARWGSANDPTNAQWVVQPYGTAGNLRRFTIGSTVPTIVRFTWRSNRIDFATVVNGSPVEQWSYTGADVPVPGGENARMNLWLYQGKAPSNGQAVDVVLRRFSYTAL